MNLKICPLNLSQNILINKLTYVKRLNNIYFDLEHDSNEEINMWFNFILDMVDEQLYFNMSRLPQLERTAHFLETKTELKKTEISDVINKIKIKAR